jgi:hypothetical protein
MTLISLRPVKEEYSFSDSMSVVHGVHCNVCHTPADLTPTNGQWLLPFGWIDLGRNRHVCPRGECLRELANNEAADKASEEGA